MKTQLNLIQYNEKQCEEIKSLDLKQVIAAKTEHMICWLDVRGLENTKLIVELGKIFTIHHLLLEDIINTKGRPKIDFFTDEVLLSYRRLNIKEGHHQVDSEQISLLLKKDWVFSFVKGLEIPFTKTRGRLDESKAKIRHREGDYLMYSLLDEVIDDYFLVLEKIGDNIDALEAGILRKNQDGFLNKLYQQKKQLKVIRQAIWPLREILERIIKSDNVLIQESNKVYFKDIQDHVIQLIDTLENYRESLNSIHEIHFTQVSMRMNEIMQVLTIMASLFIPLTFIVGVYGMNFEWMPELKLKYGYLGIWLIMIAIVIGLILFFKRKKWF